MVAGGILSLLKQYFFCEFLRKKNINEIEANFVSVFFYYYYSFGLHHSPVVNNREEKQISTDEIFAARLKIIRNH